MTELKKPATAEGRQISILLEGTTTFVGLPEGCGGRASQTLADGTLLELELWCSPTKAGVQMPSTGPQPVNMWVAKLDGRPIGEQPNPPSEEVRSWGEGGWARLWQPPYIPAGFHHRGQALDALGRHLGRSRV